MIDQLIGNYRIVRLLGQGGMGQVFEAVHEQIQRRAAIKILNPEFSSDAEVVKRFFNEALAVNVVQHPSIVGVFESGQLPTGSAFIVMEYLEGTSLASQLKAAALSEREALQLTRQLASALAATHAKDIVHRDLKPDNVMLVKDPEVPGGRRAKLLDFGIAKVSVKHQRNAVKTRDGAMMGTPAYMPPELWMSANKADDKTDVYALGTMLFEMLAQRTPFVGDNINQFMFKHVNEEPPLIRQFAPRTSAGTVALISQMLKKERSERPSMSDVAQRIEDLLAQALDESGPIRSAARASDAAMQATVLQGEETVVRADDKPAQWTNMRLGSAQAEQPPVVKRASGSIRPAQAGIVKRKSSSTKSPIIAGTIITAALLLSALLALLILR